MTKQQIALNALRLARPGGVTGSQLLEEGCGTRYGARIQDLRDQGHRISSKRVRDGLFLYTLDLDVERDTGQPPSGVALDADAPPTASQGGEQPSPSSLTPPSSLFDAAPASDSSTLTESPRWGGYDYDPEENAA